MACALHRLNRRDSADAVSRSRRRQELAAHARAMDALYVTVRQFDPQLAQTSIGMTQD